MIITTPNEIYAYIKDKKCPMCKENIEDANEIKSYDLRNGFGYYATNIFCGSCTEYAMRVEFIDPKKHLSIRETVWLYSFDDSDSEYNNTEYNVQFCYDEGITFIDNCHFLFSKKIKLDSILFNPHELTKEEMLEKIEFILFFR